MFRQRPGLSSITFVTESGDVLGNVKEANNYLKAGEYIALKCVKNRHFE